MNILIIYSSKSQMFNNNSACYWSVQRWVVKRPRQAPPQLSTNLSYPLNYPPSTPSSLLLLPLTLRPTLPQLLLFPHVPINPHSTCSDTHTSSISSLSGSKTNLNSSIFLTVLSQSTIQILHYTSCSNQSNRHSKLLLTPVTKILGLYFTWLSSFWIWTYSTNSLNKPSNAANIDITPQDHYNI